MEKEQKIKTENDNSKIMFFKISMILKKLKMKLFKFFTFKITFPK